jgi:hypothetical protein
MYKVVLGSAMVANLSAHNLLESTADIADRCHRDIAEVSTCYSM